VAGKDILGAPARAAALAVGLLLAVAPVALAQGGRDCRAPAWTSRYGSQRSSLHGCRARAGRREGHRRPRASHVSAAKLAGSARAAAIATVLATPCQNTGLTPEAGDLPALRAAVLCLVNRVRAENGRSPLAPDARLEAAAEAHSREMVALDYFQHISPSGQTPADRIKAAGYIPGLTYGYAVGENIAWGTLGLSTPEAIVRAWEASPEHLANILEDQYRETGIGVQAAVPQSLGEGEPGAIYTEDFGVIFR